jgi:hypothetical protein
MYTSPDIIKEFKSNVKLAGYAEHMYMINAYNIFLRKPDGKLYLQKLYNVWTDIEEMWRHRMQVTLLTDDKVQYWYIMNMVLSLQVS